MGSRRESKGSRENPLHAPKPSVAFDAPTGFGREARAGAGLWLQEHLPPVLFYLQTLMRIVSLYKFKSPPGPA